MYVLHDGHECIHRAKHHEILVCTEKGFEPFDGVTQQVFVSAAAADFHELAEGRIEGGAPVFHFFIREPVEVVIHCKLHHRFARLERLNEYLAFAAGTTRAPCSLAEQLEKPFGGSEVGDAEPAIGANDPDELYARKVVALGDHLRSNQDIVFAVAERVENLFAGAHVLGCVAVHANYLRIRNPFGDFFFEHLDGAAHKLVGFGAAGATRCVHRVKGGAVVAHERAVLLMVNERNVAMLAVKRFAAFGAYAHLRKTAAVHEDNCLVALLDAIGQSFAQCGRQEYALLLAHLAHVYDLHLWERRLGGAFLECDDL